VPEALLMTRITCSAECAK